MVKVGVRRRGDEAGFQYVGGPVKGFFVDQSLDTRGIRGCREEEEQRLSEYVAPILANNGVSLEKVGCAVVAGVRSNVRELSRVFESCPNLSRLWAVEPSHKMVENHLKPFLGSLPAEQQRLCTLYESRIQDAKLIPDNSVDLLITANVVTQEIIPFRGMLVCGRQISRMLAKNGVFVELHTADDLNKLLFQGRMKQLGRNSLGGDPSDLGCPLGLKILMKT